MRQDASWPSHLRATRTTIENVQIASMKQSRPLQALHYCTAHHPILVALTEEAQFFSEMADALAVARLSVRIREIGAPIAALWPVGLEYAFEVYRDIAERIGLARNAGRGRYFDADVGGFCERHCLPD